MTYKVYINNIEKQTGKGPEDFIALAKKNGFIKDSKIIVRHGEIFK